MITVAAIFILQLQGALNRREPRVLTLATLSGSPPSGLIILQSFATLNKRSQLASFFDGWCDWAADVLQSQSFYPALAFFHSTDGEGDWLTVLDAATVLMALMEEEAVGPRR